jgi:MATE family multidrug resistance protein
VNREILKLALPNILSHITVPLLGIVDMSLMGHLEKQEYLSAVSLGNEAIAFLFWNFAFLRMSTAGITAQHFGANNKPEIILTLSRAMLLVVAASLVLLAIQKPLSWVIFDKVIPGFEEAEVLAKEYFSIRIWAAPATLGKFVLFGWFIGMQNSIIPMIIEVFVNVINIALNFLFVYSLGMTSDGVALATVIAQWAGFTASVLFFLFRYKQTLAHFKASLLFTKKEIQQFFNVNKHIFIRTFMVIMVLTYFVIISSKESTTTLNVNSILRQFVFMFSFFIDGFAVAGEALAGKYFGAKNRAMLNQVVRYLFVWGFGIAVAFTATYLFFGEAIIKMFTNKPAEITEALQFVNWLIFIPLVGFVTFIWDGIYIGTTSTKLMLYSVAIASLVFFFPVHLLLSESLGNHALFLALLLFFIVRGLFQTLWQKKALAME